MLKPTKSWQDEFDRGTDNFVYPAGFSRHRTRHRSFTTIAMLQRDYRISTDNLNTYAEHG